jgi:anti-anti-sigma regulatory factor
MTAVEVVHQAGEVRLVFEPTLSISGARELRDQLEPLLAGSERLVLDASRVERIDAATLQMLAAFVASAYGAKRDTHWQGMSPAFRNAAALLDLNGLLGVPS